ncbi:MAG: glycosyltransferase family 4 protein [Clostridia bacterium]|nr:glycosyltransferase family 4 protein [Clostridia bacterium]
MKLLIITQKVDPLDNVLGFFCGWIKAFAQKCSFIRVVCLEKRNNCQLPSNVQVLSLGKESKLSRWHYLLRFYQYIFTYLDQYDSVFIHMNPIYTLLGWWIWMLAKKKYCLWINHPYGSLLARCAIAFTPTVFCTSPFAFAARYSKTNLMPAGIDTSFFVRRHNTKRLDRSFCYLGRISPIKKIDVLIRAASILDKDGENFVLNVIGSPMTESDIAYYNKLYIQAEELRRKGKLCFMPKITPTETLTIYNSYDVFVNMTPTGSLDKTILEAMACESIVLVANKSFCSILPEMCFFNENDSIDLAKKMKILLHVDADIKKKYGFDFRRFVIKEHSLDVLMEKLFPFLNT